MWLCSLSDLWNPAIRSIIKIQIHFTKTYWAFIFITAEQLVCIGINSLWHVHIPTVPDQITVPMCFVETYHCIDNSVNLDIFLNHHFLIGCYYSLIWHPAVHINANYLFPDLAPQYLSEDGTSAVLCFLSKHKVAISSQLKSLNVLKSK